MPKPCRAIIPDMNYFEVLVASSKYHGDKPLVYSYDGTLKNGSIVIAPLKNQLCPAIVLGRSLKPDYKVKPLEHVVGNLVLPRQCLELIEWLGQYYPAPIGNIATQFIPTSIVVKSEAKQVVPKTFAAKKLQPLTAEQEKVLGNTKGKSGFFLLHGDTGSGKTRVYIELAKEKLDRGQSVLILTPEIGLTAQLVADFERSLGQKVLVMHSKMSEAKRRLVWLEVYHLKSVVLIGPRSALFAPFDSLGLIVVDEAHDSSYKQEQSPYYNGVRVASQLAKIHGAQVIMGSATPSLTDYYIAKTKHLPILRMSQPAIASSHPRLEIEIVNLRDRTNLTRNGYISDSLLMSIDEALKSGSQSLIFLNRRGTARVILCQNCGWQALCPNCDLPLTYHGDSFSLLCHSCGYKSKAPSSCPVCASADIIFRSIGTKSIVDMLQKTFPDALIKRFDTDNTKLERLEHHYENLAKGKVDIIVGTQMITKGLDLPNLGLVGIINADSSLSFPDYTAQEQTFQMINQVVGRVGRGHQAGKVVVQTYSPDSHTIKSASTKDWQSFYDEQLKQREKYLFPPFCYLLKLSCTRKSQLSAKSAGEKLVEIINNMGLKVRVQGPSPGFWEKSAKGYTWQVVVKAKNRSDLITIVKALPSGWIYDLDPSNLL